MKRKKNYFRIIFSTVLIAGGIFLAGSAIPSIVRSSGSTSSQITSRGGATVEMLDYALNLKRAYNVQIFGRGGSRPVSGTQFGTNSIDPAIGVDIENAVRAIGQLPCENVESTSLGGRTFEPGVYCLESAELSESMTLDGGGSPNARFVFRVKGDIEAAPDSRIEVVNGARSAFVTLVAGGNMTLGDRSRITANLIADEDLVINGGSTVWGRAISVKGEVLITDSIVGAATGYIEICKAVTPGDPIVPGTLFAFDVAGTEYTAPVGGCSTPIVVPAGPVTVTEVSRENTDVVAIDSTPADRRVSYSLGLRQAVISVPEGDATNQTIVTFTNQTTRTGVLEICKYGLDDDVNGFFQYTVQGAPGQTFAVPVGFCSGIVTTTIPQEPNTNFSAIVTELAQSTYRLEAADTLPINRLAGPFVADQGFDLNGVALTNNVNGGYATVLLNEGGAEAQTLVNFYNRSLPGRVKVCKFIADGRIPTTTAFNFTISGTAPSSPTQTMPGSATVQTISVLPNSCTFVPGTFVVGSTVTVTETGMTPSPFTVDGGTYDFSDIRVSKIDGNPGILTADLAAKTATLTARNSLAEVDFTNFIFRPTLLKLCKAGGPGVGGSASFTLSLPNPLTSWAVSTTPIVIPVGGCRLINGPFPEIAGFPGIGTFNRGTQLTITEAANAATVLTDVTSPTGNTVTRSGLSGTITLTQVPNNINEIRFLNSLLTNNPENAARFDFDGDGSSDKVIYRNGMWWYAASGSGDAQNAIQFGTAGDKLVAADYDGDGKTDAAVYRSGTWYVLGSTQGFMAAQFGLATDIPQPGDFDGDGKADFAVFRPSEGVWYMLNSSTGFSAVQFGISSDKPVSADFDGDGKTDQAVYRSGTWYVLGSTAGFYGAQFGIASDIPVQADFDGDGKTDMAVYRAGTWHILGSANGYYAAQFGTATDTPVPADYDGDGKTDFAVYRTSTTEWHILKSSLAQTLTGGYVAAQFGSSNDVLMNY